MRQLGRLGGGASRAAKVVRSEGGFGLIELLIAMVVTSIAVMALVASMSSSHVALVRAARISTAAAVAMAEIENYRAYKYDEISLGTTSPTRTGADGRNYPITLIVAEKCPNGSTPTGSPGTCSGTPPTGGGRPVKEVTVRVFEPTKPTQVLVQESSAFDNSTGS